MSNSNSDIVELFIHLAKCVEKHDAQRVLSHMRLMEFQDSDVFERTIFDFILHITSVHYKVTIEDLLISKKRGNVLTARKMCYVLIYNNIPSLKQSDIARLFNRSRQLVNMAIQETPIHGGIKTKYDIKFMKDFDMFCEAIITYRNSFYTKNFEQHVFSSVNKIQTKKNKEDAPDK